MLFISSVAVWPALLYRGCGGGGEGGKRKRRKSQSKLHKKGPVWEFNVSEEHKNGPWLGKWKLERQSPLIWVSESFTGEHSKLSSPVGLYMTILWVLLKADVFHYAGGTWGGFNSKANDSRPHLQAALCTMLDGFVEHLLTCVESLSSIQGRGHSGNVMCCCDKESTWVLVVLSMPAPFQITFFPMSGTRSCAARCSWADQSGYGKHLVLGSYWDVKPSLQAFFTNTGVFCRSLKGFFACVTAWQGNKEAEERTFKWEGHFKLRVNVSGREIRNEVCIWAVEVPQARRGHYICFPWRKAILINQLNPDLRLSFALEYPLWSELISVIYFFTPFFFSHLPFLHSMDQVGFFLCGFTRLSRCEEKGRACIAAAIGD